MAFSIEPLPLISFLKEPKIKLPRFQRKATWKDDQKFQLCISIFKGYPVGVVIYNCTKDGTQWLLDGRQRRNALKTAWENPVNLYRYAQYFLKLKTTTTPDEIRSIFWSNVNSFLQKDKSGEDSTSENLEADIDSENESYIYDIDPEEQKGNLKTLLNIILMVHNVRKDSSAWEKRFDFTKFVSYLPYIDKGKVDPKKLKNFLLEFASEHPNFTLDQFVDHMCQFPLRDGENINKFRDSIEQNFDVIQSDINTIREAETIFSDARIGVISLKNVSPLDAQNIFSLVNSGGTQLKAEELLSAKPFWNMPVSERLLNLDVRTLVQNLYKDLDIPGEDNINSSAVVRWDICATLLDRLDKNHLFFPEFKQESKDVNMTKISLGFKLASAEAANGISAKHIEKMELCADWENMIEALIDDVNKISEILLEVNFYHDLNAWKKSIFDLFGNAITLEFITILRKVWISLDKPTVDGTARRTFIHNSLRLLDRLFYEYSNSQWRGSGDSKMAHDIENIPDRIKQIPSEDWDILINNVCKANTNYKRLEPILYYFAVLQQKRPDSLSQITYDVDHIVPQSLLEAQSTEINGISLVSLKDTLGNLALLPHKSNTKKNDKVLNEIDSDLKMDVAKYADIQIEDFEKYSDMTHLPELCEQRKEIFSDIVQNKRVSLFANNKLV